MKFDKFKDLAIGETFRFDSEYTMPYSGMKKGLARKVSKRKYVYVDDGMECEVGSINTGVLRTKE